MSYREPKVIRDREILTAAQQKGMGSTLSAFFRLSGPGWMQSAITLGGGSLGSALYLGVIGGTSMLWLNVVAIIVGVIMLSAISYVTLSSGVRPYQAINEYVNPVLGVGWVTATILANIIWCMSQFGLCFDILENNLLPGTVSNSSIHKNIVSVVLFLFALTLVFFSLRGGWLGRLFDIAIKLLVAIVVVCFAAVVVMLFNQNQINWTEIFAGLIPNPGQWFSPTDQVAELLAAIPEASRESWTQQIMASQRKVMISTTATVVGINMTFLLPYSMLNRGWDKPFRGLANFDLITGMAIPFLLVTSCIVIAASYSFHGKADKNFLSTDPIAVENSLLFEGSKSIILDKMNSDPEIRTALAEFSALADDEDRLVAESHFVATYLAGMSKEERKLVAILVKPNAGHLAKSLEPVLGEKNANLVFGLGAFGMGFSTIIILMMINGFAFSEVFHAYNSLWLKMVGALVAGMIGVCWPYFWTGDSKTWLIIMASTFGAILLPIAYVSFFGLMNSRSLLQDDMPRGIRRLVWNVLMAFGVVAALAQAISSLFTKLVDPSTNSLIAPHIGSLVLGGVVTFALLAIIGFSARKPANGSPQD